MIAEVAQVKEQVAEGRIKEALSLLTQVLAIAGSDLQNEALLFAARLAKLRTQSRKGILSKDQQDLEYARIVNGVLELSDEVIEDAETLRGFVDLKAHLEAAAQKFGVETTKYLPPAIMRRMVFSKEIGLEFRILWIDDQPDSIHHERVVLEAMNVEIAVVDASAAAADLIAQQPRYDLILSDVGRAGDERAGFAFAEQLLGQEEAVPFIFYTINTGRPLAPPANTFGIAFLPNELYHLVLDVMARKE